MKNFILILLLPLITLPSTTTKDKSSLKDNYKLERCSENLNESKSYLSSECWVGSVVFSSQTTIFFDDSKPGEVCHFVVEDQYRRCILTGKIFVRSTLISSECYSPTVYV